MASGFAPSVATSPLSSRPVPATPALPSASSPPAEVPAALVEVASSLADCVASLLPPASAGGGAAGGALDGSLLLDSEAVVPPWEPVAGVEVAAGGVEVPAGVELEELGVAGGVVEAVVEEAVFGS